MELLFKFLPLILKFDIGNNDNVGGVLRHLGRNTRSLFSYREISPKNVDKFDIWSAKYLTWEET